jgi:hypothetical protein
VNDLNQLARALQDLLTGTADRLAREAHFVKRQRKVTGSNFAQALVFSFLGDSKASASRIQCTAAAVGLEAARQSLEERYAPQCAEFLKQLLAAATAQMAGACDHCPAGPVHRGRGPGQQHRGPAGRVG